MRLQFRRATTWALSGIVVVGLPATSWVYWPAVLKAGVLPSGGDTIFIPMVESVFLAVLLIPVTGVITWLCTRKIRGEIDLLAWDSARPILSWFVTSGFASLFALCALLILTELSAPTGWYGTWWVPYTIAVMLWLVLMRATALQERTDR
jgi:hypothetical protein